MWASTPMWAKLLSFFGITAGTLVTWILVEGYQLAKFRFEAYVRELAVSAVQDAKEENSLSYKLAKELGVDQQDVAYRVSEMLRDHQALMDSVAKFNRQLKPWGTEMMRSVLVGPRVTPDGREVFIDFDRSVYVLVKTDGGKRYYMDRHGVTRWARPEN